MRTNVYVDGFNLYYGCLRHTPYRWLDLSAFFKIILPKDSIQRIRYYTAIVTAFPDDPDKPMRQLLYLRALKTIPNLDITRGRYLTNPKFLPLASSVASGKKIQYVEVMKSEEKGSDVNLGTHLLHDAHKNEYDVAVVVSNDSDLMEPIRIVREDMKKPVGVINPHKHPSIVLKNAATFLKSIRPSALARSQFPVSLSDADGTFHKPSSW